MEELINVNGKYKMIYTIHLNPLSNASSAGVAANMPIIETSMKWDGVDNRHIQDISPLLSEVRSLAKGR